MKVGILTFHASHNYGSMLQSYALQHVLTSIGVENEIINFRSDIQKALITPPLSIRHPLSSFLRLIRQPKRTIDLHNKYCRFESFIETDLVVGPEVHSIKEVENYVMNSNFDAIITGSDQIWNPECFDFDMSYLVDFDFSGKRIAYAPSLGTYPESISAEILNKMSHAINRYHSLSTREKRGCDILSTITEKHVDLVLDPTLLLDKSDYEVLTNESKSVNEPYVFYYTPREEPGYFARALEFCRMIGHKILVTQDYCEYSGSDIIRCLDCGPKEFLSIVKNASLCVGNSFHLLVFSLIFNKEFYILANEPDSRMLNILSPLQLENRLIIKTLPQRLDSPINYFDVNRRINDLKTSSLEFLNRSLLS